MISPVAFHPKWRPVSFIGMRFGHILRVRWWWRWCVPCKLEYCMTNWSVSLSVTISKDQRGLNNTYQLFQVDGYFFFQPPFENGEDESTHWIWAHVLSWHVVQLISTGWHPSAAALCWGIAGPAFFVCSFRHGAVGLLFPYTYIWFIKVYTYKFNIDIYIYIYLHSIFEKNIFIHRHTTTHLHVCTTVFLSCQRNTDLHLE